VDGIFATERTGEESQETTLETETDTHVFRLNAITRAEIAPVNSTAAPARKYLKC
jgi:hypothetical protein